MLVLDESVTYCVARTKNYYILYNLVYSLNPYFEDCELWEYGIECSLFSESNELQSTSTISHINYNKDTVTQMLYFLAENKVFPVHMLDIVTELLETQNFCKPIVLTDLAS